MLQTSMTLFAGLPDKELLAEASRLATRERQATAELIRCLIELDTRRVYLSEGYSSLFTYCTQALHLSEHAALGRIEVARAARRLPRLLLHLEDGAVTVTSARMLAPHLTAANCEELLAAARHRTKREVEEIVARLRPQPDVRSAVRKLPSAAPVEEPLPCMPGVSFPQARTVDALLPQAPPAVAAQDPARAVVTALAPERYKIQFTASRQMREKLRYAQELLRHAVPNGDIAVGFDRALGALIEDLEKQKCAATSRPHKRRSGTHASRHIPAAVRREVWRRDDGRCAYVGSSGRCGERGFLEFHHVVPFAAGGAADANNIQLRCRAHNLYEAERFFAAEMVRESRMTWG
jgi:5-methylcytosine-specific restriction endonuclease McrA